MRVRQVVPLLAVLGTLGCGSGAPPDTIRLSTPAFSYGSDLPVSYTCRADNESPPFSWDNLPKGTRSLAFIVEEVNQHTTNWVVYNIDPTATGSPEQGVPAGGVVGTNDLKKNYYIGPCGKRGEPHRYAFRVIALDARLPLPPGATRAQLEKAMKGHKLAQGELQAQDNGI